MPMVPYLAIKTSMNLALYVSIGVTAVLLMMVGFLQAVLFGCTWKRATMHAVRVFAIGASAAGVSYGFVKALHQ
jgi:VIT1/CCC1 family predicted Fe2+/Mn2+ transporter